MNVFISWSGDRSKEVALFLREWISCVLQSVEPWVSSKDIDRGSLWFSEISKRLGDTAVGIICLTQGNKDNPWILFEAGALAKGLNTNRVCTLLVDLQPTDIGDPLAQFNHTLPDKEGIYALVKTLNLSSDGKILDETVLERIFETYWPQFETEFNSILSKPTLSKSKPRPKDDVLTEILENIRSVSSRLNLLEKHVLTDSSGDILNGLKAWTDAAMDRKSGRAFIKPMDASDEVARKSWKIHFMDESSKKKDED